MLKAGRRDQTESGPLWGRIEVLSDPSKGLDGGPVCGVRDAVEHDGPLSSDFAF